MAGRVLAAIAFAGFEYLASGIGHPVITADSLLFEGCDMERAAQANPILSLGSSPAFKHAAIGVGNASGVAYRVPGVVAVAVAGSRGIFTRIQESAGFGVA